MKRHAALARSADRASSGDRIEGLLALEARIDEDGRRRVLGGSPSPSLSGMQSAAEVHWRGFLDSLVPRGLRYRIRAACGSSPATTTPASQVGIRAARKAVFPGAIWPGAIWQRCQFRLARNAIHHAPTAATRKAIGRRLRNVWNATDRASAGVRTRSRGLAAEAGLARIAQAYADAAPKLATWLERAIPKGPAVFSLPEAHWRRKAAANPIERAIPRELERRIRKIRVFPDEAARERLATASLVEIDEEWLATDRACITMTNRDG